MSAPFESSKKKFALLGPKVCWFYGLSGAGKTTLATRTAYLLNSAGHRTVILDGDQLRLGLCHDLGFAPEHRLENVRRTAEMAKLLCGQGITVIVALMTPHENMRRIARNIVGNAHFLGIYVKCDFAICAHRDPKGLYARAVTGQLRNFVGSDLFFEEPQSPNLVVETSSSTVESCVCDILKILHLSSV